MCVQEAVQLPKIYGDRTCQECRGLCHEASIRTTTKPCRQAYFCSEQCFVRHGGILNDYGYEYVDVQSK